ncbi:MAG TPA: hypothetical protein VGC41_06530 [Kofleriaceae bacterium]
MSGVAACATGMKMDQPSDARGSVDAEADASTDQGSNGSGSGHGSAAPDPTSIPLLLSEISLSPAGAEFVEIVNTSGFAVPLSHLYLCDNGNYWKLPTGAVISSGDFLVRFPDNDIVPAHGVATIALGSAADFMTAYGVLPTYSIADGTITTVAAMTPTLTDSGELLALFYWNGTSQTVADVDLMIAGAPTSGNTLVSKSGMGMYKADAMTLAPQASAPGTGKSTKRIMLETGHETQSGTGNGISGDDETSEQTASTWDTAFTAPTPGQVPPALTQ